MRTRPWRRRTHLSCLSFRCCHYLLRAQLIYCFANQTYLPIVLDVFARVIEPFGFTTSLEGVMASVETLQKFARDDMEVVQRLIAIRQVLTPTGDWIREDQQAVELERRRLEEQQLEQQRVEQSERLAAEAVARNAALARLRAKKLALGLDPSVARLPLLVQLPPPLIAAQEGDCVQLQVNVRFSRHRQWFFNGKPLDDNVEDPATRRHGAQSFTLMLARMSKRVAGEYYCSFENEEGSVISPVTRVELVEKLRAELVGTRKLGSALTQAAPVVVNIGQGGTHREAVACCITSDSSAESGNESLCVALFSTETLATLRLTPPVTASNNKIVIAWSDLSQLLVALTKSTALPIPIQTLSNIQKKKDRGLSKSSKPVKLSVSYTVNFYSLENSEISPARSPNARAPSFRAPARANSTANTIRSNLSSTPTIPKLIATHNIASPDAIQGEVRVITLLGSGKLLALSDLCYRVAVYSIDYSVNTFRLVHTFNAVDGDCICNVAASPRSSVLGIAFRRKPVLDVLQIKTSDFSVVTRRHNFALPVHCVAIDHPGMFAAVAESVGCLKAWISVANTNTNDLQSKANKEPLRSKRRFEAHVGGVSGLLWTETSSLLLSSGADGFVKVWNVAGTGVSLLAEFYMGTSVLYMTYALGSSTLVTVINSSRPRTTSGEGGRRQKVIQVHLLRRLGELEMFRSELQFRGAAQIQKLWKGRHTRILLEKLLGNKHWRHRRKASAVLSESV